MTSDRDWLRDLRASVGENETEIRIARVDLLRLLSIAEKGLEVAAQSRTLLANAYSMPDDARGMRFLSQDAVKLQWALRELEGGEDPAGASFTV